MDVHASCAAKPSKGSETHKTKKKARMARATMLRKQTPAFKPNMLAQGDGDQQGKEEKSRATVLADHVCMTAWQFLINFKFVIPPPNSCFLKRVIGLKKISGFANFESQLQRTCRNGMKRVLLET